MAHSLLSAVKSLGTGGSSGPGEEEKSAQVLTRRSEVSVFQAYGRMVIGDSRASPAFVCCLGRKSESTLAPGRPGGKRFSLVVRTV